MSDIPKDLYLDILKYVAVESLFRFRSVCKLWCLTIDNPSFSKQHINRGIGQDWIFHRYEESGKLFVLPSKKFINNTGEHSSSQSVVATNIKTLDSPGIPLLCKFSTPKYSVSSCNGFILLSSCFTDMLWRIWNPFTGESLELKHGDEFKDMKFHKYCKDTGAAGIGYDETNDDYKVVRIVGEEIYIYSVNSNEWRGLGEFPNEDRIEINNGIFAYGALHWITSCWDQDWVGIATLNLTTEIFVFRKFTLPSDFTRNNIYDNTVNFELVTLNGCLFFSCSNLRGLFVVWRIKDYGHDDTWNKIISFKDERYFRLLAYLKSNDQVLLYSGKGEYMWYDVGKKCSENVCVEVNAAGFDDEYTDGGFYTRAFPASLIRLKKSVVTTERLPLKLVFGRGVQKKRKTKPSQRKRKRARLALELKSSDPEDFPDIDKAQFSDEPLDNLFSVKELSMPGMPLELSLSSSFGNV